MAKGNNSEVTELILLGLTDSPELQAILFGIFLVTYLISVKGNLGLIMLICISPQLHTAMYFFLSHLALVDFCYTSSVTPNTLVNFLQETKRISFPACATQLCCFITFVVCELYMLSVMAYDRYVAICNPLLYSIVMNRRVCIQMVVSTYLYGFSVGLLQANLTFHLFFCNSNIINHFYCDDVPLVGLACHKTSYKNIKELLLFTLATFNTLFSLPIVLISYIFIVFAILKIKSAEGRKKAFSTCASHLTSITIFYGTIIFMYMQPESSHSLDTDKIASVFYIVVIPMLNPLIYSLRNKEVKNALKRIMEKVCSTIK
ncbi:olfactory receptor 5AL1-like [Hippopotamus amphibius kiboko]|uniref:olfactory receptor 5AL1-like n=1 Tax=Hippopotamus amphibius kiboko TaxID=575201 RepID=UPI002594D0F3|nr:olfactory receptor 5AL1-like [Hippopotamus amphibius kiboko]